MEVFYTIQFQNTGTYQADKVRITDQIDTALFYPSIRFVASSHQVTSFELHPGGLLVITFDQIYLPDSTQNEPESHGFVTFAVKRNQKFDAKEPVINSAGIFFDFNEPIFTNEVAFTVPEEQTSTTQLPNRLTQLTIYPNPSSGAIKIHFDAPIYKDLALRVFDIEGRLRHFVTSDLRCSDGLCSETLNLPGGVYFLQLTGPGFNGVGKVLLLNDGPE